MGVNVVLGHFNCENTCRYFILVRNTYLFKYAATSEWQKPQKVLESLTFWKVESNGIKDNNNKRLERLKRIKDRETPRCFEEIRGVM